MARYASAKASYAWSSRSKGAQQSPAFPRGVAVWKKITHLKYSILKIEVALWHVFSLSASCVFEAVSCRGVLE